MNFSVIAAVAAVVTGVVVALVGFEVITMSALTTFIWIGAGLVFAGLAHLG